ncbi:transposase [Candidatus Bipolaricaulota bacterium]|nr:transposase [Candidatus Bipolaricaulota bacterium]
MTKKLVEVARAYDVHPVTLSKWKSHFLEKGPEVFCDNDTVAEYEKRILELEKLLEKGIEDSLYQNIYRGLSATPIRQSRYNLLFCSSL